MLASSQADLENRRVQRLIWTSMKLLGRQETLDFKGTCRKSLSPRQLARLISLISLMSSQNSHARRPVFRF